jgi:hypothetical protein
MYGSRQVRDVITITLSSGQTHDIPAFSDTPAGYQTMSKWLIGYPSALQQRSKFFLL